MKTLLLLLLATGTFAVVSAQSIPTSSNLPIVVVKTNGQTIADEPKIMADMGIIYNGPGMRNYLTDSFNHYNGKIGIEFRGNSSQNSPKKPYGFEGCLQFQYLYVQKSRQQRRQANHGAAVGL